MKYLIDGGEGAWLVHRFTCETEADMKRTRDELQSEGWGEAEPAEWDNFQSAMPAIASILRNEEWIRIEDLEEEERVAVRRFVAGDGPLTPEETEIEDAGPSEDADESEEESAEEGAEEPAGEESEAEAEEEAAGEESEA